MSKTDPSPAESTRNGAPANADASGGEWYAAGLRFGCTQCGNCCTGPPGYVWFTEAEGRAIAAHIRIAESEFLGSFASREGDGWTLRERRTQHGYDCIFLDRRTDKAVCSIYSVRPSQCRTWPFWPENLESPARWDAVKRNTPCPGMDCGTLVPIESIRIQRDGGSR